MSKTAAVIRNTAILGGLSLTTLHILNRLETTKACTGRIATTREDKTYNWRYGSIDYKVKGYSSPVLLLHDLTLGSSKSEFKYIYEEISRTHKVFLPDLLGYGDSEKPPMTYTSGIYRDLIEDFIKNVITRRTDVIVTGATAPIVLRLAHDCPKLIGNIVMINPLGLYDQNLIPSTETKLLRLLTDIPVIGTFMYNVKATRENIECDFKSKYIYDVDSFDENRLNEMVNDYYRASHIGGIHAKYSNASFLAQYMTCQILGELQEIDNSIMIIGGEYEPEIHDNIENYIYYNGAIESCIIERTAHLPHVEKPEDFLKAIDVLITAK